MYDQKKLEKFSIDYWKRTWIALVLRYTAVWLVQKTNASISTNQMQNLNQSQPCYARFPALAADFLCLLWVPIG